MSERRSAVFFVGDVISAADEAAGAMADHLPSDSLMPELSNSIECAIMEFFVKLPEVEAAPADTLESA
jgi:hypothetical protein